MQTSESIGAIAAALAKAQGEFKNPERNKEVEVQPKKRDDGSWPPKYKFKYATFDSILEMARPILAKNEVAIIQTAGATGSAITVTTRLVHSSGEWIEESIGAAGDGRKLQDMGSTITYLKRYSLTAMLGIAADEDDDANAADGNLADVRDRQRSGSRQTQGAQTKASQSAPPSDDPFADPPAARQAEPTPKAKPDFWQRPSLDLDPKKEKSALQFADSFEKALGAAPSDKALNKLVRDNDMHLDRLTLEDRDLCNALLEKVKERQAKGLAA